MVSRTVTDLTKEVAGVTTVVCWDRDYVADVGEPFEKAELVEAEVVFFAQADDGTVWHLGQYPEEYEDGKLTESPGWLQGIKDGKAGIYMPGKPKLGDPSFSQGWAPSVPWTDLRGGVPGGSTSQGSHRELRGCSLSSTKRAKRIPVPDWRSSITPVAWVASRWAGAVSRRTGRTWNW